MYAGAVPLAGFGGMVIVDVGSEVVEQSIKEGTWGTVHSWILVVVFSLVGCDVAEDTGLSLHFLLGVVLLEEGVVVETVAVDVVGIDLINILVVSVLEVPAASGFGVHEAAAPVVGDEVDINEVVIDHKLNAALLQFTVLEAHHSIPHHNSLQVDLLPHSTVVGVINQHSQVGNVLPRV